MSVLSNSLKGIDIMLVMDISESMDLQDFSPNRLEAPKQQLLNSFQWAIGDRIGMVCFLQEKAYSLAPLDQ